MRRTNVERSAETRAALLEATVSCLVERGYSGTSTPEICRRAGVSRGAQLHHFPTKAELLVAAVEYVCACRVEEFHGLVVATGSPEQRVQVAFEQLASIASSPSLTAWVELGVAARTEPALLERMQILGLRLEEDAEQALGALFGRPLTAPPRAVVRLVLSLLDGLALRGVLHSQQGSREALGVFRVLVTPFLGELTS